MLHIRSVLRSSRVLGIDPGSRFVGWGVVEHQGRALLHVAHGVLRTDASRALEHRLADLFEKLDAALATYLPDAVAVEGVFSCKNARTALVLGHARGIALLSAARRGIPVFEYAPAQVKRAMGVGGSASKEAVARRVLGFLAVTSTARADATDALAVALCHCQRARSAVPVRERRPASCLSERLRPAVERPPRVGASG